MRIGYPRALLFYKYFPLWNEFFSQLGAEVVVSPPTNKLLLNLGTEEAENELCLPVKVFYGHARALAGKSDYLFIPRIVSVEKKAFTCPKFLGLPDMLRAVEAEVPPILDPIVDHRLSRRQRLRTVIELGQRLGHSKLKTVAAYHSGLQALHSYHSKLAAGRTPLEVLDGEAGQVNLGGLTIGVAGHPYNIYDKHISMNLIKRIRSFGAAVSTPEMVAHHDVERQASSLPKKLFWTYEREVLGTVFHWARTQAVDGIIYVLSFACGPDSLIQSLLEHELKAEESKVPMMPLVIDEHSAEAGLITRVEAFVDMLGRKKALVS